MHTFFLLLYIFHKYFKYLTIDNFFLLMHMPNEMIISHSMNTYHQGLKRRSAKSIKNTPKPNINKYKTYISKSSFPNFKTN